MDIQPAHLNRDSFRDSFKGLVTLKIIIHLPIGCPINNIISLQHLAAQVAEIAMVDLLFPALPLPGAELRFATLKARV